MEQRRLKTTVVLLFLATGASGLMYQVVWLRVLSRVLGVTIHATATVVAAFMAGLALGSFLFGRLIDRKSNQLKVYAVLELLVGATALLVAPLLSLILPLYQFVFQASGGNAELTALCRVIISFLALLVPTTMMGGTLPVLTAYLTRRANLFGRSFSVLYGLNTAGAVLGVLLSGLVILGTFGEWATVVTGALINFAVGLVAFTLARNEDRLPEREAIPSVPREATAPPISIYSTAVRRAVLVAFAMSGFTALAYEIIWTRQLIIFLKTSIYAFSGMLAVFLSGIALGSLVISRVVDRLRSPLRVFGVLELAVAAVSVLNLYLFAPLDSSFAQRLFGFSSIFYATIVLVLPLTFLFGMIAPLAAVCYTDAAASSGSSVGRLYGANTLGSILGSLVAGFVLVPSFGATHSVVALALINLALGLTLLTLESGRSLALRVAYVAGAAMILVVGYRAKNRDPFRTAIERRIEDRVGTTWMPDSNLALSSSQKILYHREGLEATVTAFEINRFKQLWINGVGMAFLTTATKLIAHLPIQLAQQPREFLAIAFGMGTTVRSALAYPDLNVTTVDLVPETFQTFKYYHADAGQVLANPRLHTVVNDGRNFLLLSPKRYDVITVDPPPPIWSAGTVNLYAREFMLLARSRLAPGGVFCLWFPGGTEQEVKSLIRTFHGVFPDGTVWSGPHRWGYYLIGTLQPLDLERFRERAKLSYADPTILRDLTEFDDPVNGPDKLESLLIWRAEELDTLTRGAPLITDDFPFTEFPLWRYLRHGSRLWHPRSTWLRPGWKPSTPGVQEATPYRDDAAPAPASAAPGTSPARTRP